MDLPHGLVLTLANSIIGVSILAMPYCFKQCGILLAILMLSFCNMISRLSCHFLIKSAIISRRKNFEYLAYHIFGGIGKFAIEIGMIGFLLGTCVAFFVVIGDLGPDIVAAFIDRDTTTTTRLTVIIFLALFCVLPLSLQRNVDSLSGLSKATIGFYLFLVIKIISDAGPQIVSGDWSKNVDLWRPSGIIQCLPIFFTALACQTQLFEIYRIVNNPSLENMNRVIKNAVNICTIVYSFVGVFGYIAFAPNGFSGNILLSFTPSTLTNIIKLGFIMSVAFSFPLVIFPCRDSLHSLMYRDGVTLHETHPEFIPEGRFKILTIIIVVVSMIVGILIPNIEFVLGLVGSSIGIMICVLFPVMCFIYVSQKDTNERLLAKVMLAIGLILMVLGTYDNLHQVRANPVIKNVANNDLKLVKSIIAESEIKKPIIHIEQVPNIINDTKEVPVKVTASADVRHEPPQPIEPQDSRQEKSNEIVQDKNQPVDNVDIEAIKKEDTETLLEQNDSHQKEHQILIDKIQKQNEVQEEIVKQQKKLIEVIEQQQDKAKEEKLKAELDAVKEIETIALKAIEKISNVKVDKTVLEEVQLKINETKAKQAEVKEDDSKSDIKLQELKLMNNLLTAKIKENNTTKEEAVKTDKHDEKSPPELIQNRQVLIEKMLPLPLVVSNLSASNQMANNTNVTFKENDL